MTELCVNIHETTNAYEQIFIFYCIVISISIFIALKLSEKEA